LRLATVKVGDAERVTVVLPSGGAVPLVEIRDGDVAGCRISSFEPLSNPVRR
jgi:hypothetical protein